VDFPHFLHILLASKPLSESDADSAFELILQGHVPEPQIAAMLALIQARGPTVDELTGAARAMRRHATPVHCPAPGVLLDTCGTGGTTKTFNISTIAALVTAAATRGRARVAKHGNKSRSGRGSAELLAALGVNIDADPVVQARCLDRAAVCFCFAQHHHPAARHAAAVRKALAFPTIFNLLGPLCNPANAQHQLLGVYDRSALDIMASTLLRLGSRRAMVVHSDDGLDEISISAPTHVAELRDGRILHTTINPRSLGFSPVPIDALQARDLSHAVQIARDVLAGIPGPCRDMVLLNAAAAILVAECTPSLDQGMTLAAGAIDSGAALQTLQALIEESHQTH
jgi:anthranilate phosphoribosyltransferase